MKKCFRVLSVAILILIAISTFTIGAFAAEECNHEFVFSVEAWGATTHSGNVQGVICMLKPPLISTLLMAFAALAVMGVNILIFLM